MSSLCTKIDMLNVFKTGMSGKSQAGQSTEGNDKKDGSRQGLLDMMIGPSMGGLSNMMAASAGQAGLDYATLLDSSGDQNLVNRLSLMQMMMPSMRPNTNAYSTYVNRQQAAYGPFNPMTGQYKPQAFLQPNSVTETKTNGGHSGGSTYRAPSISSMYSQFGSLESMQCPAHDEWDHSEMQSCLAPYNPDRAPTFEELGQDKMTCAAKGCCWDNDINRGVLLSKDVLERLCMWKVPIAGERWGLPTLDTSMEGCCRQHPCRTIPPQPVDPNMNVKQASYDQQTAPKFENSPYQNNQFQNSDNYAQAVRQTTTTRTTTTTTTTTTRPTMRTYSSYLQQQQQFQTVRQYQPVDQFQPVGQFQPVQQTGMRPVPPQPQATQAYPVRNVQVNDPYNVMNDPYANTNPATSPPQPTYVELKPAYDQNTYNNIGVGSTSGVTATIIQENGSRSG